MSKHFWILICFLLSGCVILPVKEESAPVPVAETRELTNINQVSVNLTQEQVKTIMGSSVTIGFEKYSPSANFTTITIPNPQKKETIQYRGKTYDVEYYFTQIKNPDGVIADDELTPLVFRNRRLVGKGWTFLKTIRP